tara:strand:- start:471 stop:785 length:315 start_codon:yes stop_codon:yes gene_type:complete
MGVINNEDLYPITSMVADATMIGSLPNGDTVQFSILGIVDYIAGEFDFVNYDKATRAGQHIIGNDPDYPDTINNNINDGNKYFATIKNFPPNSNADVKFIVRLR